MKLIYIIGLFFIPITTLFSQDIRFKHFTSEDGLPSNSVNTIFQDSDDFMWFGTSYGLSRFDGYDFLNFKYQVDDTLSLSNNTVVTISEDFDNNIWIGTQNGLNKFNKDKFVIERIKGFKDLYIRCILPISDSILLIGTNKNGLIKLDLKSYSTKFYTHTSDSSSISANMINCLIKDPKRGILVGTNNGLDIFDLQFETFSSVLKQNNIIDIANVIDGLAIVVRNEGLYYHWKNKFPIKVNLSKEHDDKKIVSISDTDQSTWVAFESNGVLYTNKRNSEQYHLLYDKYNKEGLSSNTIHCVYKDKWDNIWIGSFDGGLSMIENTGKKFIHLKDNFLPTGIRNNRVRSIYQDSEGDIWIGTKVNGTLSKFDRKTLTFSHYLTQTPQKDHFICSIVEHIPGQLWVGTFDGLYLFNKKTGAYKVFNHSVAGMSLSSNKIYALLKDSDMLYIAHQGTGLDVYNTSNNSLENYIPIDNDTTSLSDVRARILFKDSKNNIWVGTAKGLNKFDIETGRFKRFLNHKNDPTSISDNRILSIHEDALQNLWIGTNFGLNLMDRENETFQFYFQKDGLPDNTINGIESDEKGELWLSTRNGVSRFNPKTKKVSNFNTADGISANELSPYGQCRTSNGEILFSSNNGLTLFNPKEIIDNKNIPNVVLTNFKIANKELNLNSPDSPIDKHISCCENIILNHEQSFIGFEYVALNYSSTEKNEYAYMLEGLESDWNYVGTKREVSYTNLPSGNYILKVKASNNDGVWNEEGVALNIQILPPPWLTWWAYLLYFAVIVGLFMVYRKYAIKRIKMEHTLEQSQLNLRFFLNVSHEFRTPITLLLHPLKKILQSSNLSDAKEAAEDVNISAVKLMKLTNQLLDFRKIDMGFAPLQTQNINMVEYAQEILKPFVKLAQSHNILITFNAIDSQITAWIDVDKFEKIMSNLLSNAIKFTESGGSISINMEVKQVTSSKLSLKSKPSEYAILSIKDTGRGIAKDRINHVFERFYSDNDSYSNTGIGLHYSKSLVELHSGFIRVESQLHEGSTFTVGFPLGDEHLKVEQKISDSFESKKYCYDESMINALTYDLRSKGHDTSNDTNIQEENGDAKTKQPILLLVEDNIQLRKQLRQELSVNYRIKEADNGQDGWDKIQKHVPDLVVSDVMMPIMDGIQLCKKVKNDDHLCHIPIIMLTARSSFEHQIEGYEIGADEYIAKPFHIEVLQSRIHNILSSRKLLLQKFMSTETAVSSKALSSNNQERVFLDKLTKYIIDNISDFDLSIANIQEEMNMSRSNLYLQVNKLTGTSPRVYIHNIRLKFASELLLKDDRSIKEICYDSGFKSASHFNHLFKETYQLTPLQYRNQNK